MDESLPRATDRAELGELLSLTPMKRKARSVSSQFTKRFASQRWWDDRDPRLKSACPRKQRRNSRDPPTRWIQLTDIGKPLRVHTPRPT